MTTILYNDSKGRCGTSGSALYNSNQVLYLEFTKFGGGDLNTADANINIPFPVKEIIVRNIQFQTSESSSTVQYVVLGSTLFGGKDFAVAYTFQDPYTGLYFPSPISEYRYTYPNPEIINGVYTFSCYDPYKETSDVGDLGQCVMLVEFVSDTSDILDTTI
jgi:hypothetical protein